MKTAKLIVLFVVVLMCSCTDKDRKNDENRADAVVRAIDEGDTEPTDGGFYPYYDHFLYLSFKDAAGNDLVKGIGFDYWVPYGDGLTVTGGEDDPGGAVKPELYTLEYVYEDGIPNPWKPEPAPLIDLGDGILRPAYILDERYPEMSLNKGKSFAEAYPVINSDYDYLAFHTQSQKKYYDYSSEESVDLPFAEKIVIRLTCPYLFGDNDAHDIVTWWKLDPDWDGIHVYAALCYRIEFEGKEFIETTYEDYNQISMATVVLDK